MLTSDNYLDVVQQLQERKFQAAQEKERSRNDKAKSKCRGVLEWEEAEGSPCGRNGGSTSSKNIPTARSCTSEGPSAHRG
jgi:hypothetical protein